MDLYYTWHFGVACLLGFLLIFIVVLANWQLVFFVQLSIPVRLRVKWQEMKDNDIIGWLVISNEISLCMRHSHWSEWFPDISTVIWNMLPQSSLTGWLESSELGNSCHVLNGSLDLILIKGWLFNPRGKSLLRQHHPSNPKFLFPLRTSYWRNYRPLLYIYTHV